jgi:ubiquinone/menaquinone biosynthesis C-methylase UbiE
MTRLLLPVGRMIAVEPLPEMRDVLRRQVPKAEVVDGTAEEIPLPSALADAVVVAQAFHWFAGSQAAQEIARVLKPEGALVLVWNEKLPQDPMMEGIDAILAPYRLSSPGFASTPWREVFEKADAPLRLTSHDTFPFEESLTLHRLKGRVLSTSYIALLEKRLQSSVLRQLEELVSSTADDAPIAMKHHTEVFVARHR